MLFVRNTFRFGVAGLCIFGALSIAHAETAAPSYAVTDTLNLPGSTRWDYLTFDAGHHRLFITRGDSVDVLNTDSKTITGTIPNLEGVHGVALAPDLNKGFVTEGKGNRVTIFDLTDLKILATVPTGNKPDAIVYDQATNRVFAADGESGDVTAIDAKTNMAIGKIKLGGRPEFTVTDGKGRLYVNLEDKSQIAVVDTKNLKVVAHYNLAPACEGPTGLAIDNTHHRLFSTCANKTMVVIGSNTGEMLDALPIGQHSDAAAYDAATGLAFSSNGDGTLTIAGVDDYGGYGIVQTLETKVTARTMALDPLTHNLYMAAAETDGLSSAQNGQEPRPRIKPDTFSILTISGR